jgi:hypothetical protein
MPKPARTLPPAAAGSAAEAHTPDFGVAGGAAVCGFKSIEGADNAGTSTSCSTAVHSASLPLLVVPPILQAEPLLGKVIVIARCSKAVLRCVAAIMLAGCCCLGHARPQVAEQLLLTLALLIACCPASTAGAAASGEPGVYCGIEQPAKIAVPAARVLLALAVVPAAQQLVSAVVDTVDVLQPLLLLASLLLLQESLLERVCAVGSLLMCRSSAQLYL